MDGMQFSREATRPVSELPVRLTRERLLPRADTRAAQRRLQAVPAQLDSNGRQLFLHLAVPVERGLIDTGIRVEDLGELVLVHGLVLASQVRKSRACGRTRPDRCMSGLLNLTCGFLLVLGLGIGAGGCCVDSDEATFLQECGNRTVEAPEEPVIGVNASTRSLRVTSRLMHAKPSLCNATPRGQGGMPGAGWRRRPCPPAAGTPLCSWDDAVRPSRPLQYLGSLCIQ